MEKIQEKELPRTGGPPASRGSCIYTAVRGPAPQSVSQLVSYLVSGRMQKQAPAAQCSAGEEVPSGSSRCDADEEIPAAQPCRRAGTYEPASSTCGLTMILSVELAGTELGAWDINRLVSSSSGAIQGPGSPPSAWHPVAWRNALLVGIWSLSVSQLVELGITRSAQFRGVRHLVVLFAGRSTVVRPPKEPGVRHREFGERAYLCV